MKFTIKSEKLEHKDQIIELDFSELEVIDSVEFGVVFNSEILATLQNNYEGKSVSGKYLGPSRIDGVPMFQIDTTQLDRDNKISQILN